MTKLTLELVKQRTRAKDRIRKRQKRIIFLNERTQFDESQIQQAERRLERLIHKGR